MSAKVLTRLLLTRALVVALRPTVDTFNDAMVHTGVCNRIVRL